MKGNHETFAYLHLIYEPTRLSKHCKIEFRVDENREAEYLTTKRHWAFRILETELARLPPQTKTRFYEWRLTSNDSRLFTVKETLFDKVLVILCKEATYWSFHMFTPLGRSKQGSAQLNVPYCPDDICHQYKQIMKAIFDHI